MIKFALLASAFLISVSTSAHGATPAQTPHARLIAANRLAAPAPTPAAPMRSPRQSIGPTDDAAVIEPGRDRYVGAIQVYPWSKGALYRLYTAPGRVSDIALEPGEALISVAAGDTLRWIIGDTASGTGAARQTHVLVKPVAIGLATNLVIATDRRTYHVEVASRAGASMASISWTYPDDALLTLHGSPPPRSEEPIAGSVAIEAVNFNYRIEGDNPTWRPIRAFDDGRQVFIEFPPSFANGEAPPLFIVGEGGRAELVNYRVRGRYYLVDRLFGAAELRLGERRQQVVRIVREGKSS